MEYRLEELFNLQMGKTPSRKNPEYWCSSDNKWISISDLSKSEKYIYDTKEYITNKAVIESGISLINQNTVIMSFKLSIGKVAITAEPMYSNEAIMSFRDKKVVDLLPDYIYYLLLAQNWDDGTNKAVMGKTLNKATLSKIKVNVHSLDVQKSIVSTLDKLQSIITHLRTQLEKLDLLVKARFVEMFGDPIEKYEELRAYQLFTGDVVMGRRGEMGRCAVITENGLLCGTGSMIIRTNGRLKADYIQKIISFPSFKKTIEDMAVGQTMPNLNVPIVSKFMIVCPPIEVQDQYYSFVEKTDKSKFIAF